MSRATVPVENKTIPGEKGLPILGHTLRFIKDCNQLQMDMVEKYGPIYSNRFVGQKAIYLLSPDANEFVLLDRESNFSSRLAWNRSLGNLFPNGLMLRDGDDHRWHRRLLGAPFKSAALERYVEQMNPDIKGQVERWDSSQSILLYPAMKELTLKLAAKIFIGEELDQEIEDINRSFVDLVEASMAVVRYPMFGNKIQRGLAGRSYLENYFKTRIADKRVSADADMFAEICRIEGDVDESFTDQDIVDHIIFIMMAAHDTTTSALSSICFALAKNPDWQQRIRNEIEAADSVELSYSQMPEFESAALVLNESLRLYPPLPIIIRTAVKDCEFEGYAIKKGSMVHVSPSFTQKMPEIWSEPEKFDPERFSKERAEDRLHRHAWIPFGGGVHKCLGLKFAELQVKLVLFHLLKNYQIEVPADYQMPYQPAPIGKPSDSLPLLLRPL